MCAHRELAAKLAARPLPEIVAALEVAAADLEAAIAVAATIAGRGPEGLALNVAKTQVFLARGALALATQGAAVGSG